MNLGELWEMVKDREARRVTAHGSRRVRRDLATEERVATFTFLNNICQQILTCFCYFDMLI